MHRASVWVFCVATVAATAEKVEFRAGVARADITPAEPIRMAGYASRTHSSTGVSTRLFVKALALEDAKKNRIVILTTDLLGLPRAFTEEAGARIEKQFGLRRAQIVFNSSHTHSGPVLRPNMREMYDLTDAEWSVIERNSRRIVDALVTVAGAALGDLAPATISFGQGKAGFAVNRREFTRNGVVLGVNPKGPVDHSVPVIHVRGADGATRAILFGYACHNTTLGADFYEIDGDYAGYAQQELESRYKGSAALFVALCGGDQNPRPRESKEHAIRHGRDLADAVASVVAGPGRPLHGRFRVALQMVDLPLLFHDRETFEKELKDTNVYRTRRARAILKLYDERRPPRSVPYPVQALGLGKGLTLIALGGEVVVDYALRAKREFGHKGDVIVAAYSNDVMCYIPSLRVLREGGYEADTSMIFYGMPSKFTDEVEELIFTTLRKVMARVR